MGSVGQEFSRAEGVWLACVRSVEPGPRLEALKAESWDPLKAHSLICLVVDAGYWLRASVSLHVVSLLEPVWASSLRGGQLLKVNMEKMVRKGRRERNISTKGKLYPP